MVSIFIVLMKNTRLLSLACIFLLAPSLPIPAEKARSVSPKEALTCPDFLASIDRGDHLLIEDLVHGEVRLEGPLWKAFFQDPAIQRMYALDQHGPLAWAFPIYTFNRLSHSIGVLALALEFAPQEAVASFLHDASHGAGCHMLDLLFCGAPDLEGAGTPVAHVCDPKSTWQDLVWREFLEDSPGLLKIFREFGIEIDSLNPNINPFIKGEKQALSADRLDYVLRGALSVGLLTKEDAARIKAAIRYDQEKKKWYFTRVQEARLFARASILLTRCQWASIESVVCTIYSTCAFMRALEIGVLTIDQVCRGTDKEVVARLLSADDQVIQKYLQLLAKLPDAGMTNPLRLEDAAATPLLAPVRKRLSSPDHRTKPSFTVETSRDPRRLQEIDYPLKNRGLDPFVKVDGQVVRLSTIDPAFREDFLKSEKWARQGHRFRFTHWDDYMERVAKKVHEMSAGQ